MNPTRALPGAALVTAGLFTVSLIGTASPFSGNEVARAVEPTVTGAFIDNIHSKAGYTKGGAHVILGANLNYGGGGDRDTRPCAGYTRIPECDGWIEVYISGQPPDSDQSGGRWEFNFAAPMGSDIATGSYTGAVSPRTRSGSQPGIDIGESYCMTPTGEFTIHELTWTDHDITTFAASFEQRCAGAQEVWGPLTGEVRLNSTMGFKAATATPAAIDYGQSAVGSPAGTQTVTIEAAGTLPITLGTAEIAGADPGAFDITADGCSGSTLTVGSTCSVDVKATPNRNRVLNAKLRIPDGTARGKRVVTLTAEGVGELDAIAQISPATVYPHPDGYRDELIVSGVRTDSAALDVTVRAKDGGAVVHQGGLPAATGDFRWTWDGTVTGGAMAPIGAYGVTAVLRSPIGVERTATADIDIKHDWMEWKKTTVTRTGAKYALFKRPPGSTVSRSRSRYASGVFLDSGSRFATVVYAFKVQKAKAYQWLSFEVQGRSRNRHKAILSMHNPKLGLPWNLKNYDRSRKVGPGFKWWKTRVEDEGRKFNGKFFGAVTVAKGLGRAGRANFDIKKARLVYRYGILHAPSGAARAARSGEVRPSANGRPQGATIAQLADLTYFPSRLEKAPPLPVATPAPEPGPKSLADGDEQRDTKDQKKGGPRDRDD
jgi:hypothetical protein